MKTANALSKQLFGAKYESARKSLLTAVILFLAVYAASLRLVIAPFILYLTSAFFTMCIMWQVLNGRRHIEAMQGIYTLPFENHSLVFSYILVLGLHTLITKTLLIWVLFFAAAQWSVFEAVIALFCGCMACVVAAAVYHMFKKGRIVRSVLWVFGILAVILFVRQSIAVLTAALISGMIAVLYLYFAEPYDFYDAAAERKSVRQMSRSGNILTYFIRYLTANKNYLVNTIGLCTTACFLPLLFSKFQGLNTLPIGLAVLCLNTPICTLLSCDTDLEQAIRVLPGQAGQFCRKYCLFLFAVNVIPASIYLCSWQFIHGGIHSADVGMAILIDLQSAVLAVILEWKYPIRSWKTESDLWHHPRKYLVPLIMLLMAVSAGTWTLFFQLWSAAMLIECCLLLYATRSTPRF